MDGAELLLVIIAAIAVTSVAQRRGLQAPLVLVVVGLAVSFIPGLPRLQIDPGLILGFVLPPLLYSTTLEFSFLNFVRNLGPILGLGVVLVVVTAVAVGLVASWAVPELTLGAALVLGSVVAPPDAVTAVAIGRRLGLPKRLMTILTGESLVNDAAALTLFTLTTATVVGTRTFISGPVRFFAYGVAVGIVVGALLSVVVRLVQRRLDNPGLETVVGFVLPFASYFVAEELHASGVVAVVTAGFAMGHNANRAGYATRLQDRYLWRSVDVLLEAFVFAYMGLQFRFVLADVRADGRPVGGVLGAALLVLLVVVAVRPLYVLADHLRRLLLTRFFAWRSRRLRTRRRDDRVRARRRPARADRPGGPPPDRTPLSRSANVVLAWTGMRGVVTLAAAAGVPQLTEQGQVFPGRSTIQVIAFVVAVGSLLLQGSTLPWLIRRLDLRDPAAEDEAARQLVLAEEVMRTAGRDAVQQSMEQARADVDPDTLARLGARMEQMQQARQRLQRQSELAAAGQEAGPGEPSANDADRRARYQAAMRKVRLDTVAAQRAALTAERDAYRLDDDLYRALLEELDFDEAATTTRGESRLQ